MEFDTIRESIENRLKDYLDRAGMYYRIFSRAKSLASIKRKLDSKGEDYRAHGKKMQDLIGIRVVFYFQDDVETFHNKLKLLEGYDPKNESNSSRELSELTETIEQMNEEDAAKKHLKRLLPFHDKVFMPERLNVVMQMDENEKELVRMELETQKEYDASLIDFTYEIQLRTVLSEGWHEVEHDLRYKTSTESWWSYCELESRMLNGLYASLETSETALSRLIDEISYKGYLNHSWDAMIRFHFRRRTMEKKLSESLCNILDKKGDVAKSILHVNREKLANWLWEIGPNIPISTDTILFIVNRKELKDPDISKCESSVIKNILDKHLSQ